MAASKYDELAGMIPELVGGLDNVTFYTHCVTRLRFQIKDKSLVDLNKVKKAPGVKGAQWSGDQLQIIIGGGIEEAFEVIGKATGLGTQGGPAEPWEGKKKFNPGILLEIIAGSITPVVTLLIGTGMIKIIMLLGTMTNLIAADGSTYQVLSFVSDSAFYFLPVLVGHAAAARLGMNPYIGAFLGAMLIHPDFTTMVATGEPIHVFGLPVYAGSYSSSIFPAILSVWAASYVEKFVKKHSLEMLRSILVPFLTILVMTPVSLCALAPLGDVLGTYLSAAIIWTYETFGFIGVAIFTGLHPLLVMTGMQHGMGPYLVASLSDPGYEALASPATFIDNINIGIAALAVGMKSKIRSVKTNGIPSGITAVVGGVTEPALFGTVLQFKPVLIATMTGGFIGGAIAGLAKCVCYAFAGSYGVFGLVTFIGDKGMPNFLWMLAAVGVGAVVTFVLTMILYKDDPAELAEEAGADEADGDSTAENTEADSKIASPITGEVKALTECEDETFATGVLGNGVLIEPAEGKVYAPCNGRISNLFETLHAIGIETAGGAELLIHIGMDTVGLNGEGFTAHVKTGDSIQKGQLLLEFDMDFILSKGLPVSTPIIVTNSDDYPNMSAVLGKVTHGDKILTL